MLRGISYQHRNHHSSSTKQTSTQWLSPALTKRPDKFLSLTQVTRKKRAIIQQTVPVLLTELLFITGASYSIGEWELARTIMWEVLGKLCLGADRSLLKKSEAGDQSLTMLKASPACKHHNFDSHYPCQHRKFTANFKNTGIDSILRTKLSNFDGWNAACQHAFGPHNKK